MATVVVSSHRKTESIDLNGALSVGEALAHFYRTDVRGVENALVGQVVRLNAADVRVPGDFNTALRDRDVISVYTAEIARGGVKGARGA
mgnify:FL=1